MIIDPDRECCTIWHGNKVQRIKGNARECCDRIINYITKPFESVVNGYVRRQVIFDIKVDISGFGIAYADYLSQNNIEFIEVKAGNII